jgi:hypothetical protein
VANIAGFIFYIGGCINFGRAVGKFYLAFFIIEPYRFDGLLPADVRYNLIDIIAGVQHHGIMGAEFDGRGQAVRPGHHMLHKLFFLVSDVEIGPGGKGYEQCQSDRKDELGGQAASKIYETI